MLKHDHTVLIVDDDPVSMKMLERLLRKSFKVITASDPNRALQLIETEKVALVLADQNMPEMTGTEFLKRSRQINENIVRIIVTSNTDSRTFVDAIGTAGAIGVISKPWDPSKVENAVFEALRRHELMAENRQAASRLRQTNEKLDKVAKRDKGR